VSSNDNGNGAAKASKAQAVWNKRLLGESVHEISTQTGLSVEKVKELLESYYQSIKTEGVELHRQLALSRAEALIKVYLPIALGADCPEVQQDGEHPLRCGIFVLACLKFIGELLGMRAGPLPVDGASGRATLDWLRSQRIFIEQAAQEAPRDTFELPPGQLGSQPEDPHIEPEPASVETLEFSEIDLEETPVQQHGSRAQEDAVRARAEQNREERLHFFQQNGYDAL
jgi:hypothetical protein